ncbi:Hypothetical_protein [Hexamita inflata]|uniref:Hypothetical_protein n=1 Tax=Hexamita inflata TaxID=28002 RepID=A0AA86UU55_9EUKA|nr:Hypothetical protein HINF_LOCUS55709 [Hexamita inflata]
MRRHSTCLQGNAFGDDGFQSALSSEYYKKQSKSSCNLDSKPPINNDHIRHLAAIQESLNDQSKFNTLQNQPSSIYMKGEYSIPTKELSSDYNRNSLFTPSVKSDSEEKIEKIDVYEKLMKKVCPSQKLNMDYDVQVLLGSNNINKDFDRLQSLNCCALDESTYVFSKNIDEIERLVKEIMVAPQDQTAKYKDYDIFIQPYHQDYETEANIQEQIFQLKSRSQNYIQVLQKYACAPLVVHFEQKLLNACKHAHTEKELEMLVQMQLRRNGLPVVVLESLTDFVSRHVLISRAFIEKLEKREKLISIQELLQKIISHYRKEGAFIQYMRSSKSYSEVKKAVGDMFYVRDQLWTLLE